MPQFHRVVRGPLQTERADHFVALHGNPKSRRPATDAKEVAASGAPASGCYVVRRDFDDQRWVRHGVQPAIDAAEQAAALDLAGSALRGEATQ